MADSIEADLKMRFSSTESDLEADILAELQSIMRLHSINVEELWYKWESFIIKMGSDEMRLNIENVRNLKKNILDELESESRIKAHQLQSSKRGAINHRNVATKTGVFDILDSFVPSRTNAEKKSSKKPEACSVSKKNNSMRSIQNVKTAFKLDDHNSLPVVTPFQERSNTGQVIEILNEHLPKVDHLATQFSEPRIKLTANMDIKKLSYKTMQMKCSEASEILDDKIDEHMFLIQDHYNLEDSAFGSAANQSVNEIIAVGRIATDSSDGKLNSFSLVLESSRRMGAGLRIPLKVESLHNFQFFPGQIVAVKGINTSGESFIASEILEPPLLPGAASALANLRQHHQRLKGGPNSMDLDCDPMPLSIIVGSGPFTEDDNLDFEPLKALCKEVVYTLADGLILTGPFLDIEHPLISSGDFDLPANTVVDTEVVTMSTLFRHFITPCLNQILVANPNITIILVPSTRDAISTHVCWPQEPFLRKDLGLPKSIKVVGNPMMISLNETVFGISTQDVLTELSVSEVLGNSSKGDSMLARLPKYLIEQRSFFPIFPSVNRECLPKTGISTGTSTCAMLDTSYLKLGEIINVRPDIMILPSFLSPFAKVVESVVVLNPGNLSKGMTAGTYAKITINPVKLDLEVEDTSIIAHNVFERARVEIINI